MFKVNDKVRFSFRDANIDEDFVHDEYITDEQHKALEGQSAIITNVLHYKDGYTEYNIVFNNGIQMDFLTEKYLELI